MEKIILVHYVNVGNIPDSEVRYVMNKIMNSLTREGEGVLHYVYPIREGETKVECLNPKLVSKEEFEYAKNILEKNQKIINKILENGKI